MKRWPLDYVNLKLEKNSIEYKASENLERHNVISMASSSLK